MPGDFSRFLLVELVVWKFHLAADWGKSSLLRCAFFDVAGAIREIYAGDDIEIGCFTSRCCDDE